MLKKVFTGQPCPKGHTLRFVSGGCVECLYSRNRARRQSDPEKARDYQRQWYAKNFRRKTEQIPNCILCGAPNRPKCIARFCSERCRSISYKNTLKQRDPAEFEKKRLAKNEKNRLRRASLTRADKDQINARNKVGRLKRKESISQKSAEKYKARRDDPEFRAKRNLYRRRAAAKGRAAARALKELGICVEPLPGYGNPADGRAIAARRVLKQLGIEI